MKKNFAACIGGLAVLAFYTFSCVTNPADNDAFPDCIGVYQSKWDPAGCYYPRPLPSELNRFQSFLSSLDTLFQQQPHTVLSRDTLALLDSILFLLDAFADEQYHFTKVHLSFLVGDGLLEHSEVEAALKSLHAAERWLEKSASLVGDSCFWHYLATLHNRLGLAYSALADLDNAVANFKKAIHLNSLIGGQKESAKNYTSIGNAFQEAGEFSEAIRWHRQALCILENLWEFTLEDTTDLAWAYNNVGIALGYKADSLDNVGASTSARQFREDALQSFKYALTYIEGKETANDYLILLNIYARLNIAFQFTKHSDPSSADSIRHYITECLDFYREHAGDEQGFEPAVAYRHLAYASMRDGDCAKAGAQIDRSIEILISLGGLNDAVLGGNKQHYSNFLFSKGYILKKCAERYPDSIQYLQRSLEGYLNAIDFSEEVRQQLATDVSLEGFLRARLFQFAPAFEIAVRLHEETGNPQYLDIAFRIAERSRSFTLRQGIIRQVMKWQTEAGKTQLLETESAFRKKILSLETQAAENPEDSGILSLLQIEKERFARFIDELRNSGDIDKKKFYANRFNHSVPSIKEVQDKILDERTAVVEYMIGAEQLWSMILTLDTVMVASTAIDSSFYALINDYRYSLTTDKDAFSENAWKIYRTVFTKVDALLTLKKIENVLIIPDKQLQGILFEAMLDTPGSTSRAFDEYGYLVRKYNISYHYSVASLLKSRELMRSRPAAPMPFAGFASSLPNPKSGYTSCGSVRLTNLEAITKQTQEKYFPEFSEMVYSGARSTDFTYLAGRYVILQLALHGCADPAADGDFFLEFHPDASGDDGRLELSEIYSIDLLSQLIVLSNCHTAQGMHVSGEGIMSISRAFAYAGCPNIIGTLSAVPDPSTAEILESFYEYLLQNNDPPYIALAKAKRRFLLVNNEHPWSWNNLIHLGDILPLEFKVPNDPG